MKLLDAILRINKNRKIRYNHLKLIVVHEAPISNQIQRIQKVQEQDPNSEEYKNRELIYIPSSLAEEFMKDFY